MSKAKDYAKLRNKKQDELLVKINRVLNVWKKNNIKKIKRGEK